MLENCFIHYNLLLWRHLPVTKCRPRSLKCGLPVRNPILIINGKHARFLNAMCSNVTEPFVLATYTSTLRGAVLHKPWIGAYASVHQRANKPDEYVTVAAQADAVHILDVSLDSYKSSFSLFSKPGYLGFWFASYNFTYIGPIYLFLLPCLDFFFL
jgi:hypothetical protein